jgi:ATP-dependent helicase HrpB
MAAPDDATPVVRGARPVLPVDAVLGDVRAALAQATSAVLIAPPGAGKTTRVPPALIDAPWLGGRKIILLEPRRLAARAAAERMASERGERVGDTIGLRARLDTRVGPRTRIEVVTEGVFTRMILDDPSLEGVGAVIFDEFHERSLDADAGLAFALDARAGLREDLRILVMSATLDGARVAGLLGDAPIIEAQGRAYPVTTHYAGRPTQRIEEAMTETIMRALRAETGSLLAFLPGQGEIRCTAERLAERLDGTTFDVVELHGGLDGRAQRQAIEPASPGRRKVVLATSIAQTSITIEGVRIVVDSGLERVPRYDADAGMTRLATIAVSRATADQRRGRAGRTEPGVCWRLWDEPQTAGLRPFTEPEIRAADLSGLLLDCAAWGTPDPARLAWLDPPSAGAVAAAREELALLHAIETDGSLTATGRRLRALPLPPRLARMVIAAAEHGAARRAAEIAAVLVERGIGGRSTDVEDRLADLRRDRSPRAEGLRRLAAGWAASAEALAGAGSSSVRARRPDADERSTAALLALAYPDRIAKARGPAGAFVLSGGQGAMVDATDALARAPFLVIAELTGSAAAARIVVAARVAETELAMIARVAGAAIETQEELSFDAAASALRARRITRLGAIVLSSEPRPVAAGPESAAMLVESLARQGIDRLPWSAAQRQLCDRIGFLARAAPDAGWPDLSDAALAATAATWLAPFIGEATRLADITAAHLGAALDALIPWDLKRRLEAEAPTHFEAPTGNRHPIDYAAEGAPLVSLRVQELFGLKTHPTIAGGRLPLTLALLSPAGRPVQITRDLVGFWSGSWRDVKADMRGRYPKHPWPDDPANAPPTSRAKRRGE